MHFLKKWFCRKLASIDGGVKGDPLNERPDDSDLSTAQNPGPDRELPMEALVPYRDSTAPEQRVFLGMGCFFGVQAHLANLDGVFKTTVGTATASNVTYPDGFPASVLVPIEVVDVTFDANIISFEQLLISFFQNHHCFVDEEIYTPEHVQSCIFVVNNDQKQIAMDYRDRYSRLAQKVLGLNLSTVIGTIESYVLADESLQDYHIKFPGAIERKRPNGLPLPAE